MLMIIYVDDIVLSGPEKWMAKTWQELKDKGLKLDAPGTDFCRDGGKESSHTFLGCTHRRTTRKVQAPNGREVEVACVTSDVSDAMKKALCKYEVAVHEITGKYPHLFKTCTPVEEDETRESPMRAPYTDERFLECPSCYHTWPESEMLEKKLFESGEKRPIKKHHHLYGSEAIPPLVHDD